MYFFKNLCPDEIFFKTIPLPQFETLAAANHHSNGGSSEPPFQTAVPAKGSRSLLGLVPG
jgi:hypothetical protein